MSRVAGKPYFLYFLWSPLGRRFYIGISEDPAHRTVQHNSALHGWTARYRPWELVHVEPYADYRAARNRELQLKSQKSGQGFFHLTGLYPSRFPRRS